MLHAPAEAERGRTAVLLCSAFGQESIHAHRTFRVLAERLARAGHFALRFDYYGTGDAAGEDTDVSFAGLQHDIELADATLRAYANPRAVIWLGLGLGAAAAWFAAARAEQPPKALLAWDPVVDGKSYLAELIKRQSDFMPLTFSVPPRRLVAPPSGVVEAIGFCIADPFASELRGLSASRFPVLPRSVRATLVTSRENESTAALSGRCPPEQPLRRVALGNEIDWMVEDLNQGGLVPAAALQALLRLAAEET